MSQGMHNSKVRQTLRSSIEVSNQGQSSLKNDKIQRHQPPPGGRPVRINKSMPQVLCTEQPLGFNGTIHKNSVQILVDSGATHSVVSYEYFLHLQRSTGLTLNPETYGGWAKIANGGMLEIVGTVDLVLHFGKTSVTQSFFVLKYLAHPVILGTDFLREKRAVIDMANKVFILPEGNSVALSDSAQFNLRVCLVAKDSVTVPPRSEVQIRGSLKGKAGPKDGHCLVEPGPRLVERYGMLCAASISPIAAGVLPIQIVNPSQNPIRLHRGTILGSVTTIDLDAPLEKSSAFISLDSEGTALEQDNPDTDILDLIQCGDITDVQKAELRSLLEEYREIFAENVLELKAAKGMECTIETTTETPVRAPRPYRVPIALRDVLDNQIKQLLAQGVITHSESDWASPALLVPKPGGSYRLVVDFRKLNKVLVINNLHPLPHIFDTLTACGQSQPTLFSSMDLRSGYFQIPVSKESQKKTAFIVPGGHYAYTRLPMGIASAPSIFQRCMSQLLADLNQSVLVYLDDLLVFSSDWTQHLQHLRQLFVRLKAANLSLKPPKCYFAKQECRFSVIF